MSNVFTKNIVLLLLLSQLFMEYGCGTARIVVSDTPQAISRSQQLMINEINFARTNPAQYAELRLKEAFNNGKDNGSYVYMKNLPPVGMLEFRNSLNIAAMDYSKLLADKNAMGHFVDRTPLARCITSGFSGYSIGENLIASTNSSYNPNLDAEYVAISVVRMFIIDAGVTTLGHRLTMMKGMYKTIGIGYTRNEASMFVNYHVHEFGD